MLTKEEFKNLIQITETDEGLYLCAETSICKYGQFYKDEADTYVERLNLAKTDFIDFYYPMYLQDLGRKE